MTALPTSRVLSEQPAVSNARLIAELQAVSIGIHLVGLARLPEVMKPAAPQSQDKAA